MESTLGVIPKRLFLFSLRISEDVIGHIGQFALLQTPESLINGNITSSGTA